MSNTETLRAAAAEALDYIETPSSKLWPAGTLHRITINLRAALAQQPAASGEPAALQARVHALETMLRSWLELGYSVARDAETDALLADATAPAASGEPAEPFGYVITHNFPEGHAYRYSFYTPKSLGTAYRDTALSITPVFATAQPAPAPAEPVAEVLIDSCADHESRIEAMDYLPAGTMLYRAPQPAPALVPLTDAQVEALRARVTGAPYLTAVQLIRETEAAHGITPEKEAP